MNLEIEVGMSFEEIASVLSVMGAEHAIEIGYLTGNFKYSGVYFVFRYFRIPEDVAAEGVNVDWKAGMSGAFNCLIKYLLESSEDIKSFLTKLSIETAFKFVLSFQYESLYVIRDEFGISFQENMVG
ncbi:hypothetical protein SFA35_16635 [Pseudomonas sp. HR96]|uniref:hypothetical protein n=1 Tax=Pseudomonas sp. HR96 TaxID=1027966 RepID=UPI002A75F8FF|nr:hypothetical protein [Pseudomonas sp. HR96]WPO98267.1 hypothetical protein SFA35_16635 [Pseudomonas sp. HR96]